MLESGVGLVNVTEIRRGLATTESEDVPTNVVRRLVKKTLRL